MKIKSQTCEEEQNNINNNNNNNNFEMKTTNRAENNDNIVSVNQKRNSRIYTLNMETGKVYNIIESANDLSNGVADKVELNGDGKNGMNTKINGKQKETSSSPSANDHCKSTMRRLTLNKSDANQSFGFHLTRTKWDPYPWISAIDSASPAEVSGLQAGECLLEVNGEDVLGLRITDIAKLVQSKDEQVTLLLWSSGCDAKCDPETLCAAPMPRSLQRLSIIVQSILSIIECPVCLDTIPPPAMQCQNEHLLCVNCRIKAEKCPICRDRYTPKRALIAEKIYMAITSAYNLCRNEDKLRHKVFGGNNNLKSNKEKDGNKEEQHLQQTPIENNQENGIVATEPKEEEVKQFANGFATISTINRRLVPRRTASRLSQTSTGCYQQQSSNQVNKSKATIPTNRFLTKLLLNKAYSLENLTPTMQTMNLEALDPKTMTTTTAMTTLPLTKRHSELTTLPSSMSNGKISTVASLKERRNTAILPIITTDTSTAATTTTTTTSTLPLLPTNCKIMSTSNESNVNMEEHKSNSYSTLHVDTNDVNAHQQSEYQQQQQEQLQSCSNQLQDMTISNVKKLDNAAAAFNSNCNELQQIPNEFKHRDQDQKTQTSTFMLMDGEQR